VTKWLPVFALQDTNFETNELVTLRCGNNLYRGGVQRVGTPFESPLSSLIFRVESTSGRSRPLPSDSSSNPLIMIDGT
jgi:hypothetical protein